MMHKQHNSKKIFSSTEYISTRRVDDAKPINFTDAVFKGLADDGGLYIPTVFESLKPLLLAMPADISFVELATEICYQLFSDEFTYEQISDICTRAFSFSPIINTIDNIPNDIYLLDLFQGPSCSFKDFGACFLAAVMEKKLEQSNKQITILTATSGDTGSAVAQAFYNKKNINVVILYPSKRISPLQEKQLTTLDNNIHALEIKGNFDDCQRLVKEAFGETALCKKYNLTSANSINIGRLIPQALYYVYAWKKLYTLPEFKFGTNNWIFCVPSGNFGNLTAALLAIQWGLPIKHILAACNANDVVPNYLKKGLFEPKESIATLANAMDVGNPSNFERMQAIFKYRALYANNTKPNSVSYTKVLETTVHKEMQKVLMGASVSDAQISKEIKNFYTGYNKFICPHTAVGTFVARQFLNSETAKKHYYKKVVVLATADPGKFTEVIDKVCGVTPPIPERLALLLKKKSKSYKTKPTLQALKECLKTILT